MNLYTDTHLYLVGVNKMSGAYRYRMSFSILLNGDVVPFANVGKFMERVHKIELSI